MQILYKVVEKMVQHIMNKLQCNISIFEVFSEGGLKILLEKSKIRKNSTLKMKKEGRSNQSNMLCTAPGQST